MNHPHHPGTVHIVDDDEAVRDSLRWLLEANGYRVRSYESGETFLAEHDPTQLGVLIADVRMPGMSGLELQEQLASRASIMPIVFITGHGDVPMAVSTMKKGAVDFLEKPFDELELRDIVGRMFGEAKTRFDAAQLQRARAAVFARLTAREAQVLERIVAGRLNKQVADDLGISIKTVEAHRANIMEKLEVTSVAELIKVALAARQS